MACESTSWADKRRTPSRNKPHPSERNDRRLEKQWQNGDENGMQAAETYSDYPQR